MKRREVFSNLGFSVLGLSTLPSWANAWTGSKLQNDSLGLSADQASLLEDLAETIIPETDTPGAKTLEIAKFIKLMVGDVYSPEDRERFKNAMVKVDEVSKLLYGKTYSECSKLQKQHLLQGLEMSSDKDQKWFFNTTKGLSVRAYTSSEYYLTNIAHFEFAPGRYYGCVPLNQ